MTCVTGNRTFSVAWDRACLCPRVVGIPNSKGFKRVCLPECRDAKFAALPVVWPLTMTIVNITSPYHILSRFYRNLPLYFNLPYDIAVHIRSFYSPCGELEDVLARIYEQKRQRRIDARFDSTKGYPGEGPPCTCPSDTPGKEHNDTGRKACDHGINCFLHQHMHRKVKEGAARRVRERENKTRRKTEQEVRKAPLIICAFAVPQDGCGEHFHHETIASPHYCKEWDLEDDDLRQQASARVPDGLSFGFLGMEDQEWTQVNAMRTPETGVQDNLPVAHPLSATSDYQQPVSPKRPAPTVSVTVGEQKHDIQPQDVIPLAPPLLVDLPQAPQVVVVPLRLQRGRLFITAPSRESDPTVPAAIAAWLGSHLSTERAMRVNNTGPGEMGEQLDLEDASHTTFKVGIGKHVGLPERVGLHTGYQHPTDELTCSMLQNYYLHSYEGEYYVDVVHEALVNPHTDKFTVVKGDGQLNGSLESMVRKFLREHPRFAEMTTFDHYEYFLNTITRIANLLILRGARNQASCNPLGAVQILNTKGGLTSMRSRNAPSITRPQSDAKSSRILSTISRFVAKAARTDIFSSMDN
jgi:hypothetical protein